MKKKEGSAKVIWKPWTANIQYCLKQDFGKRLPSPLVTAQHTSISHHSLSIFYFHNNKLQERWEKKRRRKKERLNRKLVWRTRPKHKCKYNVDTAHKNRQPLGVFGAHNKHKYLRNIILPKQKQLGCFVKYPMS